jgi:Zn-dependent protease/CBS domain-containing protein
MMGFRLGSIFGIEIRIDYSWFVIFFLILWTLSRGVFPAAHPELTTSVHIAMGAAGTLLFFASLLAHELAHSLVGRARGTPVQSITLFIFGGMARASAEFRKPADEFLVAAAGPLSSFAIAAFFWLIGQIGVALAFPAAITGVAAYLAMINMILAIFNLFPGFPLDGGRILRSWVWHRTGDLRRATRVATQGGKAFGFMLIALGLLNLFGGNPIGGLWLVFIGWFVRTVAEASYTQHTLRESLAHLHARDAMTPNPHTVPPDLTLQHFLEEHVLDGMHHSYPVLENGAPVGLITLGRVKSIARDEWPRRTVADAMIPLTAELVAAPDDPLTNVLEKLSAAQTRRILVLHGDQLAGIMSQADVSRLIEKEHLREQVTGSSGY